MTCLAAWLPVIVLPLGAKTLQQECAGVQECDLRPVTLQKVYLSACMYIQRNVRAKKK